MYSAFIHLAVRPCCTDSVDYMVAWVCVILYPACTMCGYSYGSIHMAICLCRCISVWMFHNRSIMQFTGSRGRRGEEAATGDTGEGRSPP